MSSSAVKNDWVSITEGSPELPHGLGLIANIRQEQQRSHGALAPPGVSLVARGFFPSPGGFIEQ